MGISVYGGIFHFEKFINPTLTLHQISTPIKYYKNISKSRLKLLYQKKAILYKEERETLWQCNVFPNKLKNIGGLMRRFSPALYSLPYQEFTSSSCLRVASRGDVIHCIPIKSCSLVRPGMICI